MQTLVENQTLEQYKKMLVAFYQQVYCWTDEWFGLTMEDIRELERETKEELQRTILDKEKRGTANMD